MRNNFVGWNIVYSCNQFCLSKNFPSEPIVVVAVVIRVLIVANIYMGTLVLMNFNNRVA